jgi:hypothetical protein
VPVVAGDLGLYLHSEFFLDVTHLYSVKASSCEALWFGMLCSALLLFIEGRYDLPLAHIKIPTVSERNTATSTHDEDI